MTKDKWLASLKVKNLVSLTNLQTHKMITAMIVSKDVEYLQLNTGERININTGESDNKLFRIHSLK